MIETVAISVATLLVGVLIGYFPAFAGLTARVAVLESKYEKVDETLTEIRTDIKKLLERQLA